MNKIISVIIPVYNVERYLSRCIESVINQTYRDLEIILIDDGSTDSSGTICDDYAQKDSRIIVIHQKNRGLSAARNSGLDIAKGEYIGFVDSDDFISLNFYKILYDALNETNSDLSFCKVEKFLNIQDIKEDLNSYIPKEYNSINFIEEFTYAKDTVYCVVVWNKLYKKYLWNTLRFPEGKICEDEFVWYKCIFNSKKICEVDLAMYYYFIREDSIINKSYNEFPLKKEIAYLEALEDRIKFSKENKLNNFLKRTLEYRNKLLRKIYITTPKDKVPLYIKEQLKNNMKNISFIKKIKIYLKNIS